MPVRQKLSFFTAVMKNFGNISSVLNLIWLESLFSLAKGLLLYLCQLIFLFAKGHFTVLTLNVLKCDVIIQGNCIVKLFMAKMYSFLLIGLYLPLSVSSTLVYYLWARLELPRVETLMEQQLHRNLKGPLTEGKGSVWLTSLLR